MKIELSTADEKRLADHAKAAGFDDVERFAAQHLSAVAREPMLDELEPLSDSQLTASLEMLRQSEADLAAGRTHDLREALDGIASKHGLKIKR